MTGAETPRDDIGPADNAAIAPALTPEERLACSRAKLRAWYLDAYGDSAEKSAPTHGHGPEKNDPSWLGAIFDMLSDVPAATVAARWLRRWWASHPLRATVDLTTAVTREMAGPLAKQHPWMLMAGAALAGAAISRARPWRWISGGAILASLVPRVDLNTLLHWITVTINDFGARQKANEAASDAQAAVSPVPPEASAAHFDSPRSTSLH